MKKSFLILIVSVLLTGAVCAQDTLNRPFKDGPHLAYPTGGDVHTERMGFGWQVAYQWYPYLSIEASASRYTDKLGDLNVLPDPLDPEFDQEIWNVVLSARLSYSFGAFTPYLGGGAGYYRMRTRNSGVNRTIRERPEALPPGVSELRLSADMDNAFAYHVAGGIEWKITSKWEIFAEYRRVFLDTDLTIRRLEIRPAEGPIEVQRTETRETRNFSYDHGLLRAGVNYRF